MTSEQTAGIREPSLLDALIPLIFMIVLLTWSVVLFGVDAAAGPLQVALLMSAVVAAGGGAQERPLLGDAGRADRQGHLAPESQPAIATLPQAPLVDQSK